MDLSTLLLVILKRIDGERTIYAGLHLLRGKRSGQTLQDVEYYRLHPFFGLLPKLQIDLYDEAAEKIIDAAYILIDEHSIVHVTSKGREAVDCLDAYHFNGWDYRGRELIFFERLSLVVQTVSNFRAGEKLFIPIQKDLEIQRFVKKLLYRQPIGEAQFSHQIREELHHLMEKSNMIDKQKTILLHRLGGYQLTGWTWTQLADEYNVSPMSIYLYFIEGLHLLLAAIETSNETPFLRKMTEDVKVTSYLTDSSRKTKSYFERGFSMEAISTERRLKMSTIEDHFVELSIHDPSFPIEQFVSRNDIEAVIVKANELGTKRLRLLKDLFTTLSFFQLRLILGSQSGRDSK